MGGSGGSRGAGIGLHLQEEVGLVFENINVVSLGAAVESAATIGGLGSAGGVLARGDCVKEPWFGAAPFDGVPSAEDVVHV